MRHLLAIAASLSIAACGQQEPASAPANESASAAKEPASEKPAPALEGQWNVAALDGRPTGTAMTATFSRGKASIVAGCVRRAWTYTQKRNVVSFTADPAGSSNCEGQGTSAEQESAGIALQEASIVIFNKDGSEANLSGTGGNLTLRRR
jgi:predicted small lipoprotein YifL